ncbi:Asp/Glu/hydantoin racemase [Chitinimonas arctica]|uniref:Asp/Glu/hydantoin racemase n=1 Tax=Chitinimonas arctica TaxID=2594795 RepID=A0A516SCK6_9NEIS|nr:Asp/Glu/hydantoin racemase [Chitinimonas arctica]QDQ25788.1 Asp/Glu/hydantoin racemase [Chitinimonas arctica]
MHKHITFLHTSAIHIETFARLVKAIDPDVKVEHVVEEALLTDAQRVGANDPALVMRVHDAMTKAASTGAPIVVCTCSTIGGAAERTPTDRHFVPIRIDRAMADRAVALGPSILVVAALESTLGPTRELLEESANSAGVAIEIEYLVAEGAWPHFLRGDWTAYFEAVVTAVNAIAPHSVSAIVLAQASMAPAAEALSGMGIEVLSSPSLGVQSVVEQLHNRRIGLVPTC